MPDTTPVDMERLLRLQRGERYRPVIVLGPAACGKSRFVEALSRKTGAACLDLLALYREQPELAAQIAVLQPAALLEQVSREAVARAPDGICLVDNADFLLNTWTEGDRRSFAEPVLSLPEGRCRVIMAFFLQDDAAFDGLEERPQMRAAHGAPRVLRFENLVDLR